MYAYNFSFLITAAVIFATNVHSFQSDMLKESNFVQCSSRVFSSKLESKIECSFNFTKSRYYKCDYWKNNSSLRVIVHRKDNEDDLGQPSLICVSMSPLRIEVKTMDGDIDTDYTNIRQERASQSAEFAQYKISVLFPMAKKTFRNNFAARYSISNIEDSTMETKVLIALLYRTFGKVSDCYIYKLSDRFIEIKSEIVTLPCFAFVLKSSDEVLDLVYDDEDEQIDREVDKLLLHYDPMEGFTVNISALTNPSISYSCHCNGHYPDRILFSLLLPEGGNVNQLVYIVDPKYNIRTISDRSNSGVILECNGDSESIKIEGKNFINKNVFAWDRNSSSVVTEVVANVTIQPVYRNISRAIFLATVEIPYLITDDEWKTQRLEFWNRSNGYLYRHLTAVNCTDKNSGLEKKSWRIEYMDSYLPSAVLFSPLIFYESEGRFLCRGDEHKPIVKLQILGCKIALECEMNSICFERQLESKGKSALDCTRDITVLSGKSCSGDRKTHIRNGLCVTKRLLNSGIVQCSSESFNIRQAFFKGFDDKLYLERDPPGDAVLRVTIPSKINDELYTLVGYIFLCEAHAFFHEYGIQWSVTYSNGTVDKSQDSIRLIEPAIYDNEKIESTAEITFLDDAIIAVNCYAPLLYSRAWRNTSTSVIVKRAVPPEISLTETVKYFSETSKDQSITCQATGLPQPSIKWTRNGEDIKSPLTVVDSVFRHVLHFPVYNDSFSGEYACSAWNEAGKVEKLFQIHTDMGSNQLYYIIVPVIICVSGLLGYLLYLRHEKKKQYQELKNLVKTLNGTLHENGGENDPIELPFDPKYELEKHSFSIDKGKILGKGEYGIVYKGRIEGTEGPVALKTLKPNSPIEQLKALVSELKIIMYIGEHENLVTLYGAYRQEIRQSILYVAIEFCDFGSLESYLKTYKHLFLRCPVLNYHRANEDFKRDTVHQTNFAQIYSIRSLLKWCCQIASGMDYLGTKNVIHSDLATRNILLTAEGNAKVTDFGLSRRTYNYSEYIKKSKERMPWRSMALESLVSNNYSTKSDVWAYGITLWEIFSLGEVPYPGIDPTIEFVQELEKGLRNIRPKYSSPELYRVMIECWHSDPNQRPSFSTLKMLFEDAVSKNKDNLDIEISDDLDLENIALMLSSADYIDNGMGEC